MGRPLRRDVAGLGRPRSVDPRCALRGDHGSELPCRAHQEAAHCAPLPRRQLTARREATTVMSGVRSRHHTGSVWATPSGSRWATVDTLVFIWGPTPGVTAPVPVPVEWMPVLFPLLFVALWCLMGFLLAWIGGWGVLA